MKLLSTDTKKLSRNNLLLQYIEEASLGRPFLFSNFSVFNVLIMICFIFLESI